MKYMLIFTVLLMLTAPQVRAESGDHEGHLMMVTAFESHSEDRTPTDETKDNDDMAFVTDFARLNFKGKVANELSYRLRVRLNKDSTSAKDDGLDDNVDYAYFDHKVGEDGIVRLGKQAVEICGFEQDWGSFRRYRLTEACAAADKFKYNNGVSYHHKFGDHKVSAGIMNRSKTFETNENGHVLGASYGGDFMDGLLHFRLAYAAFAHGKQKDASANVTAESGIDTTIGAGLRVKHNGLVGEIEYITFEDKNLSPGGGDDSEVNSIHAHVRYTVGQWTPFVKYEMSKAGKDITSVSVNGLSSDAPTSANMDEKTGMAVGVEYRVWDDVEFEYFAYYQSDKFKDTSSSTASSDYTDNVVKVGFRTDVSLF